MASLAVLCALALLVGCGSDDGAGSAPETGPVVLVTYSSFVLDKAVQAHVEATIGAKLEIRQDGDAGEAVTKAVATAGRPEGDVFFGVDNTLMRLALDHDVFEPYTPEALSSVPGSFDLDPSHRVVPIDSGSVCVDYDKQWFTDHGMTPPATFDDLADPRFKDLLVIESPVASTPGQVFLAATHARFGAATDDYWRRLRANGVAVANSWDTAWTTRYTVHGGDRPLVLSYASSPPAEVVYDGLAAPRTGVAEQTCGLQVEFAGVLRGAKHPKLARKLVEAMLSSEWQSALPTTNFVDPVRTGVTAPSAYATWAVHPPDPIRIAPADVGANRAAWIEQWRAIFE